MKNLGVVITDGVGFRNFILSEFIKEANGNFDNVVIFSCLPISVYEGFDLDCKIVELKVFEEKFPTWFFRKCKEVTHLQIFKNKNFSILDNLNSTKTKANNPRGIATRLIHLFSKYFHSEKLILIYNQLQHKTFKSNFITSEYIRLFKQYEISILFFTHQRPPFIAPIIFSAEKLKIKTCAFIFSWDNLSSKGRMAGNFDYYLVWSELMKNELLHFYSSIKQKNIEVVGTPQFEPFVVEKFGYDKNTLIKKFNIDNSLPILFFTCNDSSSKNDPIYLKLLAEFIVSKKLIKEVNLIVRTSPVEEPSRFVDIAKEYKFIIWNNPDWKSTRNNHQEAWTQRVPSIDDLNDLKTLLRFCDININVLSTITLDAFIFDKPVINPVFGNLENGMYNDQKFLKYQHLVKVVESNATHIVKNKIEFLNAINNLLLKSDNKSNERKQFLELQISKPLLNTSQRIAETLKNWS